MQLKSLEVHGFKSFANKEKFVFDKGVTGIVGPNGCGKSNIVDAIRWVLGEQKTRNLRSEKMSNVIFNGTSKRKKANFCQVTMTFENTKNILPTEYSTVAISRKLYQSGESEYAINAVPCRLKDIQNLFMDTGISPESYAIIELKMVDEILNDKEGSRRFLFEEAAGISKYKIRKKQTLKKLNDTQVDLDRVEDLLYEIEKQLKSLERQAKKAEKYLQIKARYKSKSSQYAWIQIQGLRTTYEAIESRQKLLENQLTALQSNIAQSEARHMELKNEQLLREEKLSTAQKELNQHIEKIREVEKEKSVRNERLKYLQQREVAINNQILEEKKQQASLEEAIKQLKNQEETQFLQFEQNKNALKKLEQSLEIQRTKQSKQKEETASLEQQLKEIERRAVTMRKELDIKEIQRKSLSEEINRNQADQAAKVNELDSFADTLKKLTSQKEVLEKEVQQLEQLKVKNEASLQNFEQDIDTLKDNIYKCNRKLDARNNEYDLTKSLVENLEGFPESVKFLKKEAKWIKNVPLLSDIFVATEEYKIAFENLLEPYLSYYVVPGRADALQAVKLLSDSAKGRANFFILDELQEFATPDSPLIQNTIPALNCIEFSPEYTKLAAYLLQNVYLVKSENDIPDNIPPAAHFITSSGTLLSKKYSLSGGSVGLFQGKRLGRAKNLEKLNKEIRSLEKELTQLKSKLDKSISQYQHLKQEQQKLPLQAQRQNLEAINKDYFVLEAREKEYREFINQTGQRTDIIRKKIDGLSTEIQTLLPKINTLDEELEKFENQISTSRQKLEYETESLSDINQQYNQLHIDYIRAQNLYENTQKDLQQKEQRIIHLANSGTKLRQELSENQENIQQLVRNSLENDDQIIGFYEVKKTKEAYTERLEQEVASTRNSIRQVEELLRRQRREKEELEQKRQAENEKTTEIKLKLNAINERMQAEFQVNITDLEEEELFPQDSPIPDNKDVENEMLRLRQKLQNYGEVNPMAVTSFNEMKERYDFINDQKTDLEAARNILLKTIEEIDQTATARFIEAFQQIRKHFQEVFRTLFSEQDSCDLLLVDPDNPLESSIDIIAKPKGKRPLTINQLSGGEKTLTAIALLFSIYLLKPAPFCVFDEVDAPLDDANIDKFVQIIKEFSRSSQFIIVTHNKRTMVASNRLYGVTMQETGISMLRGVDLDMLGLN